MKKLLFLLLVIFSVKSSIGAKKIIPRAGDGGIYFFNTGGFLQPGDTGCIQAGAIYPYIYMENIHGTAAKPIVIMNSGGQVSYGRVNAYGWAVYKSTYFKITGTGDNAYFYGFKTYGTASAKFGVGISIKDGCTEYEVDHIDMNQVGNGFLCKIDPQNCSPQTYSTGWTIRNPKFHDCRIRNATGEAMYIVNTASYVSVNDCNGNAITIEPVMADGAKIYNMIIDSSGWDGIQLAAAPNSEIYNCRVTNYGLINMGSQQAGILLGGKTSGSVHDNYIRQGTGNGIQIFGTALTKIYNNVIIDAGFDGTSVRQDALLIDDRPDPGTKYTGLQVYVLNNTIVNPGRNSMRLYNSYGTMATGNKVQNNLLVKPNGTSSYDDPYIYLGAGVNIDTTQNMRIKVLADAKFVNTAIHDYHSLSNSPAVNTGINTSAYGVTKDIDGISRAQGSAFDAGAYEFISGTPPPNQSPSANAGNDAAITLPTSSTTLTGSGTDTDGTISGYSWAKVSGPSGGTISSPNSAAITVTGLVQGVYKFEITVSDNNGATGKDTVQITENAAGNKAPSANAGNDAVITLPTSSTTLTGNGTDTDGTISGYSWAKVSGPSGGTISSPNSAATTIIGLVQGVYKFEITVADNNGATGKDTVQVTENAAGNKAPSAHAGNDAVITLPTSSTTLTGSGADTDGTISSYSWVKVSGPSGGTISSPNSAATTITGLVQGVYKFSITVTDNGGATGKDTVQVTENAAVNKAPSAHAGNDAVITLPTSSTTLTGSGTDTDGTISGYSWAKISGPSGGTISSPNSAATTITGLVQGVYKFAITVTDNNGAAGKDTVQAIVNAAILSGPVADAGGDANIIYPKNFSSLNGSATDNSGIITAYQWKKISGPFIYKIANKAAAQTTVTYLLPGTYKFELTVTNNNGVTDKDTMQIVVSVTLGRPYTDTDTIETSILRAFPNPVRDILTLDIQNAKPFKKLLITIMNLSGNIVYKQVVNKSKGNLQMTHKIDFSAIQQGSYIVNVKFGNKNKQISTKIIKVN